jgi:hypothetical protein
MAVVANPTDRMLSATRADLRAAYDAEAREWVEEVSVALRRLKPGERVTITSRPLVAELERADDGAKGGT